MYRLVPGVCCILLTGVVCGCGDGKATVDGTVTVDNKPLEKGAITFVSTGSEQVREGAVITNGAFTAKLPPGAYKLEVNAKRVTGTRIEKGFDGKDEEVVDTEPLLPEKYNVKTTLTETIKAGKNTITLKLESKS